MKKDPADYTAGERKYADLKKAVAAGRPNAVIYLKNAAVTEAGDFVIGLTYNIDLQRYSCSAIEIDGIRYNDPKRWDKHGGSLDADISDLLISSVNDGVRTI